MSQVMRGLHWKRCLIYIDDILVFGVMTLSPRCTTWN